MEVFFSNVIQRTKKASFIFDPFSFIFLTLINQYRDFYIQIFGITCKRCDFSFFYTYHNFNLSRCPNCGQEHCKYCMEDFDQSRHDSSKCRQRYIILYFLGLMAFMALYLKFIFMCNSHSVTKYSMVTICLCEYTMFYNEVDGFLSNCISIKNIILGIILLVYYNEGDIIFFILVGIVQMICVVLINLIIDRYKKKINKKYNENEDSENSSEE